MRDRVRQELDAVRPLAEALDADRLRDGSWLAPVVDVALDGYAPDVDTLRAAFPEGEVDEVADGHIALAQRRALIAGGLSAGAYASVVLGGLATGAGTLLALPAAVSAFAVDLFYVTRVQLRLGLELAVLYDQPVDVRAPEALVDLVRTSFGLDADRAGHEVALGFAPEASRLGSRAATTASRLVQQRLLATTGQALARRGLVKLAFPAVGVPICAAVNHYTTGAVGRTARGIFRGRARAELLAEALDGALIAEVVALVVGADGRLRSAESVLLEGLGSAELPVRGEDRVLAAVRCAPRSIREAVYRAAIEAVALDGRLHEAEHALLQRLADAAGVPFDPREVTAAVWAMR